MKTNKELELLIEPIISIYQSIELDLILLIAKKFDIYEEVGVTRSLDWYMLKLEELGGLNNEALDVIKGYSNLTEEKIKEMLNAAGYSNFDLNTCQRAYKNNVISVNPNSIFNSHIMNSIINNSYMEISDTFKMINTKALESTKQAYMDVLNKAYSEVSLGVYDYNTSITRAVENLIESGISGATYKRKDGKLVKYSLESTVRRDIKTAITQLANKGSEVIANELGAEYYEVSSHLGARTGDFTNPITNHSHWQGKIYKIEGFDKNYDNFYTQTGYGDILGLGGVNCRHRFWPYFPGISERSKIDVDISENERVYELSKKQRYLENQIRKEKKKIIIAKETNNKELELQSKKRLKLKNQKIQSFCNDNNLKRNKNREKVYL